MIVVLKGQGDNIRVFHLCVSHITNQGERGTCLEGVVAKKNNQ